MSTPGPTRRIPQRAEPLARLLLPGEYRAPEPTQENAWDVANSGQHTFVQASGLGPFPTADMVDEVLHGGKETATLPVQTFDNGIATVNTETAEKLGFSMDELKEVFKPYCTKVEEIKTNQEFAK